jgi:hypothetical protein
VRFPKILHYTKPQIYHKKCIWDKGKGSFAFVRMGKFEGMMADFAKELLVTVFVVTVFV